jgi:hypothetical protein
MANDKAQEAVEFLREAEDAESENRQRGLEALRFRYGEQWPQNAIDLRGSERPRLTINETSTYIKKICNMQRQQRPRGKASPVDSFADKKIAKVITGLGRHIEVNSDADNAYDTAFDFAATIGWGYWRLRHDYIDEMSFDQDIYVDFVDNPFSVYFDKNSKLPDGSDAERAMLTDMMRKSQFEKDYPGLQSANFVDGGTGDALPDWGTKDDVRIAELYSVERTKAKLVKLSSGLVLWENEFNHVKDVALASGESVVGERDSYRRVVKWRKQSAADILEQRTLPGRWIPVVPVYWTRVVIDNKRLVQGLVKDAMDPARMVNFWHTAITEAIALAPKAKWLMAEGQDEGHEREWAQANISNVSTLRYKPTDVNGQPAQPPERIQPEPPPAGMIEAAFLASQNLSRVMGVFDPAVRGGAQHKSDKTLNAEQGQSENTNFDGYDNLMRSIKHSWRIILSWIPTIYDTQRVARIIGEDGREEMVTLNEPKQQSEDGQAINKVLNDVTVGTYDVVMETGPGYNTRRQEGVAATMQLLETPVGEKVAAVADDLIIRNMDFPGSDLIADRLAAANPLAQIDEKDEVPAKAQMMIKALQQNVQQLQQQLQAAGIEIKLGLKKEQMKQEGETRRTLMKETAHSHDVLVNAETRQHDVESRALTAQNVEEIKAMTALFLKHIDTTQLEREIQSREKQQEAKAAEQTTADTATAQ